MSSQTEFPCSLVIDVPFPTHRLASTALRALQVDAELSPLVQRTISLRTSTETTADHEAQPSDGAQTNGDTTESVLHTEYRATTNRMLRVAVNGYMESLGVVLQIMEELDVDVLERPT